MVLNGFPIIPQKMHIFCKNPENVLKSTRIMCIISILHICRIWFPKTYFLGHTDNMVFTESTRKYFERIPHRVRSALANSKSPVPFEYEDEPFFKSYEALYRLWTNRDSQRSVAESHGISRRKLVELEQSFVHCGALGLLPKLSFLEIDARLEQLVVLIKRARPHERSNHALR
ncbi:conserved hypothetical protein, partial [delta proteobacterium NaphS2]